MFRGRSLNDVSKILKPFGGCEASFNNRAASTAAIKGRFFYERFNGNLPLVL